jgi:hypothetical protein
MVVLADGGDVSSSHEPLHGRVARVVPLLHGVWWLLGML